MKAASSPMSSTMRARSSCWYWPAPPWASRPPAAARIRRQGHRNPPAPPFPASPTSSSCTSPCSTAAATPCRSSPATSSTWSRTARRRRSRCSAARTRRWRSGLVVDNSSSMLTRRAMVLAGIKAFADASQAEDQAFTIVFNEDVRRALPGQRRVHQQPDDAAGLGERRAGGRQDRAARRGDCRPRPSRHRRAPEARAGGAVGRRGQRQPCSPRTRCCAGRIAPTPSSTPCPPRGST